MTVKREEGDEMKAGEYIGLDGDGRSWQQSPSGIWHHYYYGAETGVLAENLRAAAAALVALADELETEYVELEPLPPAGVWRIVLKTGVACCIQYQKSNGEWVNDSSSGPGALALDAYRKAAGQERGQR